MKRFLTDDRAISPVIGFALVLAILVSLLGYMQTHFVPVWNAEAESEHFENVYQDLVLFSSEVQSAAISGIPRTSGIRLGFIYPKRGIFYNPKEALFGILTVNPNVNVNISYTTVFNTTTVSYRSSSLQYELPGNHPFLVYEHGIIIRDFSKFGLPNASGSPNTLIVGDNINIPLLLLNGSGFSDVHIQPDILSIFPIELTSKKNFVQYLTSINIAMDTNYPQVWNQTFNKSYKQNQDPVFISATGLTTVRVTNSSTSKKIYINTTAGNEIDLPDPTQQVIQSGRLYAGMAIEKTVATLASYQGTGQESMGLGSVWKDVPPPSKISQIILTNITTDQTITNNKLDGDVILFKIADVSGNYWFIYAEFTYNNGEKICRITSKTARGISYYKDYSIDPNANCLTTSDSKLFTNVTQVDLFNNSKWNNNSVGAYQNSSISTPNSLVSIWMGESAPSGQGQTYITESALVYYKLIIQ